MAGGFSLAAHMGHEVVSAGVDRTIEQITEDILRRKGRVAQEYVAIGRALTEAKAKLDHGDWLPWLSDTVDFSERMAQGLMAIASAPNPQALADLGLTKAMTLASLPDARRDALLSTSHEVDGVEKTVAEMSTRELKKIMASVKPTYENPAPVVGQVVKTGTVWQPIDEEHRPTRGSLIVVAQIINQQSHYFVLPTPNGFLNLYKTCHGWMPIEPFDLEVYP